MNNELEAANAEPLSVVAGKIAHHAKKSEEYVISAAMLIREARRRVEAGEAGDVKWYEWAPKNIELSMSRLRELQRIADADDPAKELERLRRLNQKRVEKHRDKKAAQRKILEEDRERLVAWAKSAPIADVRRMLDMIVDQSARGPSARRSVSPAALVGLVPTIERRDSRFGLGS